VSKPAPKFEDQEVVEIPDDDEQNIKAENIEGSENYDYSGDGEDQVNRHWIIL
jgi:hypothetical protein